MVIVFNNTLLNIKEGKAGELHVNKAILFLRKYLFLLLLITITANLILRDLQLTSFLFKAKAVIAIIAFLTEIIFIVYLFVRQRQHDLSEGQDNLTKTHNNYNKRYIDYLLSMLLIAPVMLVESFDLLNEYGVDFNNSIDYLSFNKAYYTSYFSILELFTFCFGLISLVITIASIYLLKINKLKRMQKRVRSKNDLNPKRLVVIKEECTQILQRFGKLVDTLQTGYNKQVKTVVSAEDNEFLKRKMDEIEWRLEQLNSCIPDTKEIAFLDIVLEKKGIIYDSNLEEEMDTIALSDVVGYLERKGKIYNSKFKTEITNECDIGLLINEKKFALIRCSIDEWFHNIDKYAFDDNKKGKQERDKLNNYNKIEIEITSHEDVINLSIKDNGMGMNPDAKRKHKSTKIGIPKIRRDMKKIGGKARIESESQLKDATYTKLTLEIPIHYDLV